SDPNYIYAQAQSIVWNSACGNSNGCQLGAWATTDGGTSWTYMEGSQGGALGDCGFDYPQNWYDQGIAVDRTIPTACFSTHMTFGSQRVRELCGTISPVVIPAGPR